MTETERLELIRDVCVFWEYEYPNNPTLTWHSSAWSQITLDIIAPISGCPKSGYSVSNRQKAISIMRRKSPTLYEKVKPFLNVKGGK